MKVAPLVETAQELSKIPIGRLRRRSLEGAAQRGSNPSMGRRHIQLDDATVHTVQF